MITRIGTVKNIKTGQRGYCTRIEEMKFTAGLYTYWIRFDGCSSDAPFTYSVDDWEDDDKDENYRSLYGILGEE